MIFQLSLYFLLLFLRKGLLEKFYPKYEEFHGVKISNDAILKAVSLSKRYITDRFLPDKAIDLIDEACSRVKMKHQFKSAKMKSLEEKIKTLSEEKEKAMHESGWI